MIESVESDEAPIWIDESSGMPRGDVDEIIIHDYYGLIEISSFDFNAENEGIEEVRNSGDGFFVPVSEDEMLRVRGRYDKILEENRKLRVHNRQIKEDLSETRSQLTTARRIASASDKVDPEDNVSLRRRRRDFGIERLPPHDFFIEQSLLGAYIYDPSLMQHHSQPYVQKMFYDLRHAEIHKSMMDLGQKLNLPLLEADLRKRKALEAAGGGAYIMGIVEAGKGCGVDSVHSLFDSLEFLHLQRNVVRAATAMVSNVYEGFYWPEENDPWGKNRKKIESMPGYIRAAAAKMLSLLPNRFVLYQDIKTTLEDVKTDFRVHVSRGGKPAISTGLKGIDRITHGIAPGRLIAVGARPKMGKSTFNINLAYNLALQKFGTAIFAYETTRREYLERFISRHGMVDSEIFHYFENLPSGTEERVEKAIDEVGKFPIYIETGKPNIEDIVGRATELKMLHPEIRLVIVDGMQAFKGNVPYQGNKSDVYYEILKGLKSEVAGRLEVTTVINAQLKEQVEKRRNKMPRDANDFSDCKGLAEVVDAAIALYRPEEYWSEDEKFRNWMQVIPIAVRVGDKRGKTARLNVDMRYSYMYEAPKL